MRRLLDVRDLKVRFGHSGRWAVDGISFELNEGEALALLGESGAGKTSVGRSLLRLNPSDAEVEGSIVFRGIEILHADIKILSKLRGAEIALVSQEPELVLNPFIRVGKQIEEVLRAHTGLNKQERRQRVYDSLATVGLGAREMYNAYSHQLSGGERQRVAIAQALICQPALLIADEPTSALDTVIQAQILRLIGDLRQRFHLTLIFITHDYSLLDGLADRVLVMRSGRIIESGPFKQVCMLPQDRYTQALLKIVPFPSLSQ